MATNDVYLVRLGVPGPCRDCVRTHGHGPVLDHLTYSEPGHLPDEPHRLMAFDAEFGAEVVRGFADLGAELVPYTGEIPDGYLPPDEWLFDDNGEVASRPLEVPHG